MPNTLVKKEIELDEQLLVEVAELLGTDSAAETVNAALQKILADHRRSDSLDWMINQSRAGAFDEMLDPARKMEAWRLHNS